MDNVPLITRAQAKEARALLGCSLLQVCRALCLSPETLRRVETGLQRGRMSEYLARTLRHYYEVSGAEFATNEPGGPGVRLKAEGARVIPHVSRFRPYSVPDRAYGSPHGHR